MSEFLIVFREMFEAGLIVGMLWMAFKKLGDLRGIKTTLWGAAAGLAASVVVGVVLGRFMSWMGGSPIEDLLEGVLLYVAAGFLLYVVVWLGQKARHLEDIKEATSLAASSAKYIPIFLMAFFAILREGFEVVLFIGASVKADGNLSVLGSSLGVVVAVGLLCALFVQGKNIPLRFLFRSTTLLLILFGAGMSAYATHELEEFLTKTDRLHWVGLEGKEEIKRPWNVFEPKTSAEAPSWAYSRKGEKHIHVLHDKGFVGGQLKAFLGYNSNPNWLELVLWVLYLGVGLAIWVRFGKQPHQKL